MSSYASNVVPKECEGMRLDAYMASQGLYPTRSAAAKCIADGYCALNGKLPRKSASVCAGDVLEYETYEDPHAPELVAADIPLDIRYEDDYLLVISKQAGLVCHPAEGHYGDTLVNALIAHCGKENLCDVQGEQDRLGIVHRLDRDTSGLMLCAKTNEVGLALMEDIRLKDVDRHYLALVQGWIPLDTGIVDAPIARGGRDRLRMEVSDREDARPSITTFTVKRRFEPGKNDDGFTLHRLQALYGPYASDSRAYGIHQASVRGRSGVWLEEEGESRPRPTVPPFVPPCVHSSHYGRAYGV